VIFYLLSNPVRAGLNERMTDYRWRAHPDMAPKRPVYVNSQRLFEILGATPEKGQIIYHELIQSSQKNPKTKLNPKEYPFKRKVST